MCTPPHTCKDVHYRHVIYTSGGFTLLIRTLCTACDRLFHMDPKPWPSQSTPILCDIRSVNPPQSGSIGHEHECMRLYPPSSEASLHLHIHVESVVSKRSLCDVFSSLSLLDPATLKRRPCSRSLVDSQLRMTLKLALRRRRRKRRRWGNPWPTP